MQRAGTGHFRDDGPRHHVARGQFLERVARFHEPLAQGVAQDGPFAAQGLREQKAGRPFQGSAVG